MSAEARHKLSFQGRGILEWRHETERRPPLMQQRKDGEEETCPEGLHCCDAAGHRSPARQFGSDGLFCSHKNGHHVCRQIPEAAPPTLGVPAGDG
eukprot:1308478-Prymnesium_polylepis.1